MIESQITLITILKEIVLNYENKIASLQAPTILDLNKDLLSQIRKDLSLIIELDLQVVEELLEDVNIKEKEKNSIYNYLSTIKTLLKHNKEHKTTFIITKDQLKYVDAFFDKVDELLKNQEITKANNLKNINKLSNIHNKYQELLNLLKDKNNRTFINDQDLINLLFSECELDEATKKNIVLNLLRYNQEVFKKKKHAQF